MHLKSDIPIVDVGTRTQNPVRTMIMFPGLIYGSGEGIQKTTAPIRYVIDLYTQIGRAGTWGPGANVVSNGHVKDCASACLTVLKAALDGKAQEGAEGRLESLFKCSNFVGSDQPMVSMHGWASAWMFDKGLVTMGGSKPMPPAVAFRRLLYPKVKRPYTLGWEPAESRKVVGDGIASCGT
ncbi:hypothetical protein IW261DRAFT_1556323 [Armillaria novae-zelandiae]|uniref:Uncharacterized protein n=1 Tax=Armillaria novae-zelandiae TaxID=153914 RepID=A0AA39PV68_9AGAR|nr:hypothetical protein IW261DRAFT_1556323 [Armillaria novae-zelandiae]